MGNLGMNASWLAGPILQITLLVLMIHRKLHLVFPRFFAYVIYQLAKGAVLFAVYRYYPDNYFDAYWSGNAISVLLGLVIIDEILQHLLKQYGGIQKLTTVIFRWTCGLLLVLSIVNTFSTPQSSADRVVAAVLSFDRSERMIQCGLCLLLLVLCRFMKNCWRQHEFGIALGFGLFACTEMILVSVVMYFGDGPGAIVSLIKSTAYDLVTLLWIVYLWRPSEAPIEADAAQPLSAFNIVLVGSAEPGDPGFIAMVEQMVDRVLSRGNWPRPATQGSEIIARHPGTEEQN